MKQATIIMFINFGGAFLIALLYAFRNRDDIHSFFYPDEWNEITMIERDTNTLTWIERKNKELRFEFNSGYYNMYDTYATILEDKKRYELEKIKIKKDYERNLINQEEYLKRLDETELKIDEYIDKTVEGATCVYRAGRLNKFFYNEGNEDPIDMRNLFSTGNPRLKNEILKMELSENWEEPTTPMQEAWNKLAPLVYFGIGVAITWFLITRAK